MHNNEYYVKYAKTLQDMGANSICVKDMAGLLAPYTCYDLISELKKELNIPVEATTPQAWLPCPCSRALRRVLISSIPR